MYIYICVYVAMYAVYQILKLIHTYLIAHTYSILTKLQKLKHNVQEVLTCVYFLIYIEF